MRQAGVELNGHAQGARKGLEKGLALMVGIGAAQVIKMQRDLGMIYKTLKKLVDKIEVELADKLPCPLTMKLKAWAAREVDHDP